MPRTRALVAACLATVLGVGLAPAASAQDASQKRDQVRRQRQAVQRELDAAKASDAKLEAEVERLNGAVRRQQNRVDDARRAAAVAAVRVGEAERELAAIEARARAARAALVANAVDVYMGGTSDEASLLAGASDPNDSARRRMYLQVFQTRGQDVIDELRAAKKDQIAAKAALDRARADATNRAAAEDRQAALLGDARAAQVGAREALQARIAKLQDHSRQLAAQEAQIQALLQRASRSNGPVSNIGLIWPVRGPVTSEYGSRWGSFHSGIDIAPPAGTPIRAAKSGTVVFSGYNGGYGNFVLIDHGGGVATAYAHMATVSMSQGQSVTQGQTVGTVGSTGNSTGPHLHFEVRINGAARNPRSYLP